MGSINVDNFFEAINSLAKRQVESTPIDLTVDAEVKVPYNLDIGEYKVEYQGDTFSAFSQNPEVVYQKGEHVYVLVPSGDFSNKKVILGRSSYSLNMTYQERQDMTNFYIDKGPNWIGELYKVRAPLQICPCPLGEKEGLITGKGFYQDFGFQRHLPEPRESYNRYPATYMTQEELDEADSQLQIYANLYEYLKVKASFRTEFLMTHNVGEYALVIEYLIKNPAYKKDMIPVAKTERKTPANDVIVDVSLAWSKDGNQRYPESVDLQLMDGNLPVPDTTTNKYLVNIKENPVDKSWKYTFKGLAEYEKDHPDAEYSVKVTIHTKNEKEPIPEYVTQEVRLGFKDFGGDPYTFPVNTPQTAYFKVEKGVIKGLSRVSLWQNGSFVCDIRQSLDKDGLPIYDSANAVLDKNSIFADDLEIRFAEKVNLTDNLFYPWIETPQGSQLYEASAKHPLGKTSLELIAHLNYGREDVMSSDQCVVKWFRQDWTVTKASADNAKKDEHGKTHVDYSGPGWIPIEDLIKSGENEYEVDFNVLHIKKISAVPWEWKYKAVIIYQDKTICEVEQLIRRFDSKYDLAIVQSTMEEVWKKIQKELSDFNARVNETKYQTDVEYRVWVDKERNRIQTKYATHDENEEVILETVDKKRQLMSEIDVFEKKIDQNLYDSDAEYRETINAQRAGLKKQLRDMPSYEPGDENQCGAYRPMYATWYLLLPDESYNKISVNYLRGPIGVNHWLKSSLVTFRAIVYDPYQIDPDNSGTASDTRAQPIGCLEHTIVQTEDASVVAEWEGTKLFNYDAQGTAYPWIKETEYMVRARLKWSAGTTMFNTEIIGPNNAVLGDVEAYDQNGEKTGRGYTYDGSMMTNMWADHQNIVHFRVREKYDEKRSDNTIYLKITTISGKEYVLPCPITFTKDGDQGTQGSDWVSPIWPCNVEPTSEANPLPPYSVRVNYETPLVLIPKPGFAPEGSIPDNGWMQSPHCRRVVLRPFVQKQGTFVESMDPTHGYFYKVFWDVRHNQNAKNPKAKLASCLRLVDPTTGVRFPWGSETTDGWCPYKAGLKYNEAIDNDENLRAGLCAMTHYPSVQTLDHHVTDEETYGAIEVQYWDNGDRVNMRDMLYNFQIRAEIEVWRTDYHYDLDTQKNGPNMESPHAERLKTIVSWYPLDILFNPDNVVFEPNWLRLNWPRYVTYDASGYNPNVNNYKLNLWYGMTALQGELGLERAIKVYNETPLVQKVSTSIDKEQQPPEIFQRYDPNPHLDYTAGGFGVLRSVPDPLANKDSPFYHGWYLRNQLFTTNPYGNVDINGWDGVGIDIDEEAGTIFAPTIGAGFKSPLTNLFTGVLIGVDKNYPRDAYENLLEGDSRFTRKGLDIAYPREEVSTYPYMTGVFGYQRGRSSFGILENGTAFFGRKDRGGRIIIDGNNATIYGGANGILHSPTIGDPMWNAMRLTMVDLTHTTAGDHEGNIWENGGEWDDKETPSFMPVDGVSQGFDGSYFGKEGLPENMQMPKWYETCWSEAYIRPDGKLPYFMYLNRIGSKFRTYEQYKEWAASADGYNIPVEDLNAKELMSQNKLKDYGAPIDYYHGKFLRDKESEQHNAVQLTGFGPNRASTTPAIEIGQHMHGLMPGVIPWNKVVDVLTDLRIPGDRNFMVTYDGTMWAMNGVFMGNVIGSNILGGRIQGGEIGIGVPTDGDVYNSYNYSWVAKDAGCEWDELLAPVELKGHAYFGDGDAVDGYGRPIPPTKFYVDPQGNCYAHMMNVYGGCIDLGSFHVLGPESGHNEGDYGHIIQFGESDFVGPTHIYGNIGIGPNLRDNYVLPPGADDATQMPHGSNYGNLYQTKGQVGMGILLPDRDTRYHGQLAGADGFMGAASAHLVPYNANSNDGTFGYTGIGNEYSLEQISFFGIDTSTDKPLTEGSPIGREAFQGHFWPMSFQWRENQVFDQTGKPVLSAYMTTMNIFKNDGYNFSAGDSTYRPQIRGQNYFRVGPVGTEGMVHYIRTKWQDETECSLPSGSNQAACKDYIGWFGIVNRGGDGSATTDDNYAIGATSWFGAPIIFSSDGEAAWHVRGHLHLLVRAIGSNANSQLQTWEPKAGCGYGVHMSMGSLYTEDPAKIGGHNFLLKTAKGPISFQVDDLDKIGYGVSQMGNSPNMEQGIGGMLIDPSKVIADGKAQIVIWGRKNTEIHLVSMPEKGKHNDSNARRTQNGEIRITPQSIRMGVPAKNSAFALCADYDPHGPTQPHLKRGFAFDLQQMIIKHDANILMGSGGNWDGNPAGWEAFFAICTGTYASTGNASRTPKKDGAPNIGCKQGALDFSYKIVAFGHGPKAYFAGYTNKFTFGGAWANPDNQHNIFARFG